MHVGYALHGGAFGEADEHSFERLGVAARVLLRVAAVVVVGVREVEAASRSTVPFLWDLRVETKMWDVVDTEQREWNTVCFELR